MSEKNQTPPTREQMIQWYKDEIELATLRADLAKLQRDAAVSEAERIQAISVIAQITQAPDEEDQEPTSRKLKREPANAD